MIRCHHRIMALIKKIADHTAGGLQLRRDLQAGFSTGSTQNKKRLRACVPLPSPAETETCCVAAERDYLGAANLIVFPRSKLDTIK